MSSKASLIMQLYEQAGGTTSRSNGTRLIQSTNTLLNETATEAKCAAQQENIVLESSVYETFVDRPKSLLVIDTRMIKPGDQIRITETKNFIPTGRYMIKTVRDIITGTTENGVCAGKSVLALQDILW